MRQEGVRMASGRRQDNLASGWRQDDVKRRGARIKWLEQGVGAGAATGRVPGPQPRAGAIHAVGYGI